MNNYLIRTLVRFSSSWSDHDIQLTFSVDKVDLLLSVYRRVWRSCHRTLSTIWAIRIYCSMWCVGCVVLVEVQSTSPHCFLFVNSCSSQVCIVTLATRILSRKKTYIYIHQPFRDGSHIIVRLNNRTRCIHHYLYNTEELYLKYFLE